MYIKSGILLLYYYYYFSLLEFYDMGIVSCIILEYRTVIYKTLDKRIFGCSDQNYPNTVPQSTIS